MSDKQEASLFQITKPVRLVYENLFEARHVGPRGSTNGTPKYDVTLTIPPDHPDLPAMKALALEVARAKWPGRDVIGDARNNLFKFPFDSGDKIADRAKQRGKDEEFKRGQIVLASRSKYEPSLSAVVNGKLIEYTGIGGNPPRAAAKQHFYRGVEVLVQVNFVAYNGVGQNPDGVTAYLNMVLSLGTGERIAGGARSAAEVFKGYVGLNSQVDPTAGSLMDDDIPF